MDTLSHPLVVWLSMPTLAPPISWNLNWGGVCTTGAHSTCTPYMYMQTVAVHFAPCLILNIVMVDYILISTGDPLVSLITTIPKVRESFGHFLFEPRQCV